MEKRNIQRTGGSSFTVTLPKKWIEERGLTERDALYIDEDISGNLVITSQNKRNSTSRSVLNIDGYTPAWIYREIIGLYLTGAEEISVTSTRITPEQRAKIRETTQSLLGLEIIDESATDIHIKNIFDVTKLPVAKNIDNMFFITQAMLSDAIHAFLSTDSLLAHDVMNRDVEIDKLYFVITRQFHSLLSKRCTEEELGMSVLDSNYYAYVAAQIERIADHTVKIARQVPIKGEKKSESELSVYYKKVEEIMVTCVKETQQMVATNDKKIAHSLLDSNQTVLLTNDGVNLQKINPIVVDSFERMYRYMSNIAEMTIDHALIT